MISIRTFCWIERPGVPILAVVKLASLIPGLVLAATVAGGGTLVARLAGAAGIVVSPLVAALLLGLVLAQVGRLPNAVGPGVAFACRPLLRAAIVLLGLRIGLAQIGAVGVLGLATIAGIVTATLVIGYWTARRLGLSQDLAWLLAAGHAICGAAAVAATDSVLKTRQHEVTTALTLVTLLGTVALIACPLLGKALGMTPAAYGFWVGGSVHEVAQAVAAGFALGDECGEAASLVKMVRVAFLLPLGLVLGVVAARREGRAAGKIVVPWFVVGFAVVAVLDALGCVPPKLADLLRSACTVAMTVAMAALGLKSSLRELARTGMRPLLAATLTTLVVSALAFAGAAALRG